MTSGVVCGGANSVDLSRIRKQVFSLWTLREQLNSVSECVKSCCFAFDIPLLIGHLL